MGLKVPYLHNVVRECDLCYVSPSSLANLFQSLRTLARPSLVSTIKAYCAPAQSRLLTCDMRRAIDCAVASAPVVLFMKGTPELPQCGFSRATIQILGLQGVDPEKFAAFNVLEDEALRNGQ